MGGGPSVGNTVGDGLGEGDGLGVAKAYSFPALSTMYSVASMPITGEPRLADPCRE
jgi:hypothetical protein